MSHRSGHTSSPNRLAIAALRRAKDAGGGMMRLQFLAEAQKHIAQLDPRLDRATVNQLQGHVLALQGRGGDSQIAHVSGGETPAFSDGTNWRRYADRAVVS